MSPTVASLLFAIGIMGLFALDRDKTEKTAKAVWIAVAWLLLAGSRNVGEWLQTGPPLENSDRYIEGNPIDRNILSALVIIGIIVLVCRGQRVAEILRKNPAICLYFLYCAVSVVWSDYPYVGLKRWIRASGDLVMVLVIVTDTNSVGALKRALSRAGFVLVPVSILLIRYYPQIGRTYGMFDGTLAWTGVTTSKNTLGVVCSVFGLGCLWRIVLAWHERSNPCRRRQLAAQGALLAMVLWLLWVANSMTSLSCFVMGGTVILVTSSRTFMRGIRVHVLVAMMVCASFAVLFLNLSSGALQAMGRDPTLTGRTDVWNVVLRFSDNPLLGAGFETFWLGKRLEGIGAIIGGLNQCHNGYLEVYVNLGLVGVALLLAVIATGYKRVVSAARNQPDVGPLRLAYFVVGVIYNFTEAGVKMMMPIWIFFLLSIMFQSGSRRQPAANRELVLSTEGRIGDGLPYTETDYPDRKAGSAAIAQSSYDVEPTTSKSRF